VAHFNLALLLAYLHFPLSNGYLIVEVLDYSVLTCYIYRVYIIKNTSLVNSLLKEKLDNLNKKGFEILYTDGSVAFVRSKSNTIKSFYANSNRSLLTAEPTALEKAINFANSENLVKIAILTDSLGALQTLKKCCVSNCIALDIFK